MAKIIKKAQNGIKAKPVPVKRIKQVADSLDNVASQKMKASMNRTTKSGGSYDNVSKELNRQANKDSSNASRYRKLADKASSKEKMAMGGSLKKPSTDQKGLKKLPTPVRNKMGYQKNGGATMMKTGGAVKKLQNGGGSTAKKEYVKRMNTADSLSSTAQKKANDNITLAISGLKGYNPVSNPLTKSGGKDSIESEKLRNKKSLGPIKSKMKGGGMIKRADGSFSKRGLWDNIRANKGSGKKPTKQMLAQGKKINAKAKK